MLYKEYGRVAAMRLKFLASQDRHAEQFTVGKQGSVSLFINFKFSIHELKSLSNMDRKFVPTDSIFVVFEINLVHSTINLCISCLSGSC